MNNALKMIVFAIITIIPTVISNWIVGVSCAICTIIMYWYSEKDNHKLKNKSLELESKDIQLEKDNNNLKKESDYIRLQLRYMLFDKNHQSTENTLDTKPTYLPRETELSKQFTKEELEILSKDFDV